MWPLAIGVTWVAFWIGWLAAATTAKRNRVHNPYHVGVRVGIIVAVILARAVIHPHGLVIHSLVLHLAGSALLVSGLGLAIWARVDLGGNWGMPMTEKEGAELVTTGPYARVRNPIYSGILLAGVGTALALDLLVLIVVVVVGAYFVYSARVEEGIMARLFPDAYPAYRDRTKMLIPYVL